MKQSLFAVAHNRLLTRGLFAPDSTWLDIGPGEDVIALTAIGSALFGATKLGRLLCRFAMLEEIPWADIGNIPSPLGLAATNLTATPQRLVCLSQEVGDMRGLYARVPVLTESGWERFDNAWGMDALTASSGRLFGFCSLVAGGRGIHAHDPVSRETGWYRIGDASDVRSLAGGEDKLHALTKDGSIWAREPALLNTGWELIGKLPDAVALGVATCVG